MSTGSAGFRSSVNVRTRPAHTSICAAATRTHPVCQDLDAPHGRKKGLLGPRRILLLRATPLIRGMLHVSGCPELGIS
ncbi:unnamed protein product [Penicillium camemberti]|uniref:Str. FM013 n=1 Tax=Penicillium camemberti (strain FM 013) TaxID=1429867 RepID=A0A0G4PUB8_PENC3|nr:unnamed protein product [Penicillium camemberti]